MGRSNPWGDLDQMWRVERHGGRNHVCNIWWLSVKGCGCGERGKFAFFYWLEVSPLHRVELWVQRLLTSRQLQQPHRWWLVMCWWLAYVLSCARMWVVAGPSHWADAYPECGGERQSPINIKLDKAKYKDLGNLTLSGYDTSSGHVYKLTNNGHTGMAYE